MLRTRIARLAHELDSLRPVWATLQRSPDATMFQSWRWNRLAAQMFAARERPCVVCVENDTGAALIPAALHPFGLTLLGETLFDYRDVLFQGDPGILSHAWAALAGLGKGISFSGLRGSLAAHWNWAELHPFASAPQVLQSECSAAEFTAEHTQSARKLRRLSRLGVVFRRRSGSATGLARWLYQRKAEQAIAGQTNLFADPLRVEFMVEISAASADACEIFTLETAGKIVAALLTFRDRAVRRFYTIYYDHAWARFSPGVALIYEVTRQSLAEGVDCDYMTGEQSHKTRFATSSVPLHRVAASAQDLYQIGAELLPAAA